MGNRAEAIRQKKARNKGYYASDVSECKYKYGGACWHAWMDGWNANESHLTKRALDGAKAPRKSKRSTGSPRK